jgi:hypothetical protein
MELPDDMIRESLQENMQRIEDDSFTEEVVRLHLERRRKPVPRPFFNFPALLTGIAMVLISIGISLLILTDMIDLSGFELAAKDGLILLFLSLLFLIYKWLDELLLQRSIKLDNT